MQRLLQQMIKKQTYLKCRGIRRRPWFELLIFDFQKRSLQFISVQFLANYKAKNKVLIQVRTIFFIQTVECLDDRRVEFKK